MIDGGVCDRQHEFLREEKLFDTRPGSAWHGARVNGALVELHMPLTPKGVQ